MPIKRRKSNLENLIVAGMTSKKVINQAGRLYAGTSGLCARQATLQANYNAEEVQEPQTTGYYATGNAVETIVLDALFDKEILLFADFRIPDIEINLGGKVDGFVVDDNKVKGIEVKSCGSTLPTHPKLEHKAQALLYSAITGLPFTLIYFSRMIADKDQQILVRSFELDFNWLDRYQTLYQAVLGYFGSKYQVMPKPASWISSEADCGFCRFKAICWQGQPSFMPSIETLDFKEQSAIYDLAETLTTELMTSEAVENRRNGVLKHISINGTKHAQKLLKDHDWNCLLTNDN